MADSIFDFRWTPQRNEVGMAEDRFKLLTIDNWQQPDPVLSVFVHYSPHGGSPRVVGGTEWAGSILGVELSEKAPLEVQRLFAVARGALVYGYFFYPLYSLGLEQVFRVAEAAVGHKCKQLDVPELKLEKMRFQQRVAHLVKERVISPAAEPEWDTLRHLRNLASHPSDQTIVPTGVAIDMLRRIAAAIDALFEN